MNGFYADRYTYWATEGFMESGITKAGLAD